MESPSRSSSCSSQAQLLRRRGDLRGRRTAFNVKLAKADHLALQAENPLDRIGLDLRRGRMPARLLVADVDKNPRKRTPVAKWNTEQERAADRSEEEQHASFALLPGDRLRAINEVNGETAMLAELMDCVNFTSPKAVDLAISRDISDVMHLAPNHRDGGCKQLSAHARQQALRIEEERCGHHRLAAQGRPATHSGVGMTRHSGSSSRASSAGSICSSCSSPARTRSCGQRSVRPRTSASLVRIGMAAMS
jgi:hypothetical protein